MHPASAALLRVASSSFAVMKMRAPRSRCRKSTLQLDPRNSAEVDVEQQTGCRLRAAALDQRLGRGERTAVDAVVRQQPRHALQKTRIVIDYDHERRLRHHIRVQSRGIHGPSGGRPILDLDQWNLDRYGSDFTGQGATS